MLPPALSIYTYNKLKCWHISRATPQSPFWRGGYGVTDSAIANWDIGFGEITGKLGFVGSFNFFAKLFKVDTKEYKAQQLAATAANTARGKKMGENLWKGHTFAGDENCVCGGCLLGLCDTHGDDCTCGVCGDAARARGKKMGDIHGPLNVKNGTGAFDKKYDDKRQEWRKKGKGVKMGTGKRGTKVS